MNMQPNVLQHLKYMRVRIHLLLHKPKHVIFRSVTKRSGKLFMLQVHRYSGISKYFWGEWEEYKKSNSDVTEERNLPSTITTKKKVSMRLYIPQHKDHLHHQTVFTLHTIPKTKVSNVRVHFSNYPPILWITSIPDHPRWIRSCLHWIPKSYTAYSNVSGWKDEN